MIYKTFTHMINIHHDLTVKNSLAILGTDRLIKINTIRDILRWKCHHFRSTFPLPCKVYSKSTRTFVTRWCVWIILKHPRKPFIRERLYLRSEYDKCFVLWISQIEHTICENCVTHLTFTWNSEANKIVEAPFIVIRGQWTVIVINGQRRLSV